MKSSSLIRKKYSFNNIQILSKYELQNKFESVLKNISPKEIISDLSFFKEISIYFDSSSPEKAFIAYKFTLFCFYLANNKESNFFLKLFIKYSKIFIKTCHKYNSFIIIKIITNNVFINDKTKKLSINEFNQIINSLLDEYKNDPYNSIMKLNFQNFKSDMGKSLFFILLDCFKFAFNKDQIKAISKYLVAHSIVIIENILNDKTSKISYFKKLNNIVQSHIKEIQNIITNNNSKKKCIFYMSEFFISIIAIYDEIIRLFDMGLYDFYDKDFIIGYIQKNLVVTIMKFLEKKYFVLDEKITSAIIKLSTNIENYLLNKVKIEQKKFFIEYSWIMAQFFDFLYHCEDKSKSIEYGNKIIELYRKKSYVSRAVIFIKLTLYENLLKIQKKSFSEYNIEEHLNNISDLITMFGNCEIENEESERYLIKMINHLFQIMIEHIIFIINNRRNQIKNLYNLLLLINPFLINCRDNSVNKNVVKKVNYFNTFCFITTIISSNSDCNSKENNIYNFLKESNLNEEEKNLFINIISIFCIYDKNNLQKIFQLLKDLYNTSEDKYFLEVYFKIFYQLEKNEYYNITLLYNLLNLLIKFMNEKLNTNNNSRNGNINLDFSNNYFPIYSVYVFNTIKFSYREILKVNEKENGFDQNNNLDSEGLLIKLSNCIKIINKFIELHNKILDIFYRMDKDNNSNKSIYYLHYNIIINFLLEFLDSENEYSSKNVSLLYQQLYLVATNKTIFSSLPLLTQNFIYYCLYRLIHNINSILKNRDLFLINGNFEVSKTIKTIIYNNILLIKEERKKIKKNNDSFFNLELLLSSSIMCENCDSNISDNISFYNALTEKKFILNESVKNQFNNFKINFIIDSNSLIEAIKLHYLIGNPIDKEYMQKYFDYYIPILSNEKQFGNKFSNILNIFYLIKRIFEIPKTGNQNEKINVESLCEIIRKKGNNFITKKNIIVRLLVKYIYSTQGKWENKKKLNDLLICLLNELDELKKDKNIVNNEQKNQTYLTYIELISLEYFINVYNGELSDNNIDELLYKGKKLLMKCIELFKAFLNEKYIMQYLPNEKHRLRSFNDYFFDEINKVDLLYSKLYLLDMDDYEYILLQLLNKIYILTDFLFKKMYSFGLGDSILEIFHKFRTFSIIKFNKFYFTKFISYVIKVVRKWKTKREYDITGDINDFKSDSEYDIFISKIYFNYAYSLYSKFKYNRNDNFYDFKINEFVNKNQINNDPLLNKCLELLNINENSTDKEKNIFFKNKIKSLINQDIYYNNDKNNDRKELQNLFLKIFNISQASNFYLANFLSIENKYTINILPKLFNDEIISHIILNEKNIEIVINLFKSCYKSFKIDNWTEYKYIKYCKKNLRNLIYLSSSSQIYDISLKLINLYIEYFHNFKYNFSYVGNINQDKFILNEDDIIDNSNNIDNNIDNLETIDNISCDNGNDDKINIESTAINLIKINIIEKNFYASNIISVFRIRNLFYIYLKIKNESSYDIINMDTEKDFQMFFNNMKNISLNENSSKKIKKKAKNEEYKNALFELQNIFIKHCPNFIKVIKLYYYSHINFNNYINTKINKYSLKISSNEIINWLFEPNVDKIKYKHISNFNNTNARFKLMSIIDYKKKFINKIFNSNKFKFSFYEGNINDLFYYIPSVELSKIPIENIPLLFNLVIIRSLNTNYIKLNPIRKNISITKEIFCLLNPKKDLVDTEKKILPIINKYKIKCINSKEPTEQEMNSIINDKLMYLFCGHGDSLKYLKKEYIESHKIKFLTFLFGCNSATSRLISGKDTQPLSTPQLFLKQLCPFFFGFLWPVSSLDLDDITIELLDTLFKSKNQISLLKTISLLKRKFNLRWFNGAALVIYCNCDILTKFEE